MTGVKTSGFENYSSATVLCHSLLSEVKAGSSARRVSDFRADLSEYKSKPKEEAGAHRQPSEGYCSGFLFRLVISTGATVFQ